MGVGCCSYQVCLYAKKFWHLLNYISLETLELRNGKNLSRHSALKSTEVDIFGTFIIIRCYFRGFFRARRMCAKNINIKKMIL